MSERRYLPEWYLVDIIRHFVFIGNSKQLLSGYFISLFFVSLFV